MTDSPLSILVDENISKLTVDCLLGKGWHVVDLRGSSNQGVDDCDVWEIAQREKALLITSDRAFLRYRDSSHHGLLVVCLRQPNQHSINDHVMRAMSRFGPLDWPNLTVHMRDRALRTWRSRQSG